MKNVVFSLLLIAIITIMVSCNKEQVSRNSATNIHNTLTGNVNNNSSHTYGVPKLRNQYNPLESIDCFMRQGGGGDDDKPIIMHIVEGPGRIPVPGAELIMISNTDTLQQTTDSEGHCYFQLLRKGDWELIVLQEGFYPYATQVSITDTFHVINSILQPR